MKTSGPLFLARCLNRCNCSCAGGGIRILLRVIVSAYLLWSCVSLVSVVSMFRILSRTAANGCRLYQGRNVMGGVANTRILFKHYIDNGSGLGSGRRYSLPFSTATSLPAAVITTTAEGSVQRTLPAQINNCAEMANLIVGFDATTEEEINEIIRMAGVLHLSLEAAPLVISRSEQKIIKTAKTFDPWFYNWLKAAIANPTRSFPFPSSNYPSIVQLPDENLKSRFAVALASTRKFDNFALFDDELNSQGSSSSSSGSNGNNMAQANDIVKKLCSRTTAATIVQMTEALESFAADKVGMPLFRKMLLYQRGVLSDHILPIFEYMGAPATSSEIAVVHEKEAKRSKLEANLSTELQSIFDLIEEGNSHTSVGSLSSDHEASSSSSASTVSEPVTSSSRSPRGPAPTRQPLKYNSKFSMKHKHHVVFHCYRKSAEPPKEQDGGYKLLITNLPNEIDENVLAHALRNCGEVDRVALFRSTQSQQLAEQKKLKVFNTIEISPTDIADLDNLNSPDEDGSAAIDAAAMLDDDADEDILVPKNPLATFTSIKKLKKPKPGKAVMQVLEPFVTDNYAFLWMSDENGYQNCVRDELRIFGITIKVGNYFGRSAGGWHLM
jgi:hypothetical protein